MIPLIVNGITFNYPEVNDTEWGYEATNWAAAITNGTLQKAGGTFILQSDVDFGNNYGIKSSYISTRAADPADTGLIRLSNTDTICWRNFANTSNICLQPTGTDTLSFNGIELIDASTPQTLTNKTILDPIIDFTGDPYSVWVNDGSGTLDFITGNTDQVVQKTSTNVVFGKYLQQNVLKASSPPTGATQGDQYYNTSTNRSYTYNGANWTQLQAQITNTEGVVITNPANGQSLVYNNPNWVNTTHSYTREATTLTTGAATTTLLSIDIPTSRAVAFTAQVSAHRQSNGDAMVLHWSGAIKRSAAGVTTFVSGSYQEAVFEDTGATSWDAVLVADDPDDQLDINITGIAGATIRWVVRIDYTLYTT